MGPRAYLQAFSLYGDRFAYAPDARVLAAEVDNPSVLSVDLGRGILGAHAMARES